MSIMIGYCKESKRWVVSEADCLFCKKVDLTLCRHWSDWEEPKYGIGDTVFVLELNTQPLYENCFLCDGSSIITVTKEGKSIANATSFKSFPNDKSINYKCPECRGEGKVRIGQKEVYKISPPRTVGRVTVEKGIVFKGEQGTEETEHIEEKIRYMCIETGIGSGRVYKEENLFATKEEAEKECEKRNSRIQEF